MRVCGGMAPQKLNSDKTGSNTIAYCFSGRMLIYVTFSLFLFQKRGDCYEHANHRHRQPERRRWQDNDLCELGRRAGTDREESAADRRGPARQPDHQPGPPPAGQAALYPVRRNGPYPDGRTAAPRRGYPAPPGGR